MASKFVMFCDTAMEKLPLARVHFPAHKARLDEFHARGTLLMAGPLVPAGDMALGIFTSREAADEFIKDEPFLLNGVVKTHRVVEWREVLA
jgi:uncharacterized protein YciI